MRLISPNTNEIELVTISTVYILKKVKLTFKIIGNTTSSKVCWRASTPQLMLGRSKYSVQKGRPGKMTCLNSFSSCWLKIHTKLYKFK